nr:uncharacterized protein LOC112920886 [Vulpes vulpes]
MQKSGTEKHRAGSSPCAYQGRCSVAKDGRGRRKWELQVDGQRCRTESPRCDGQAGGEAARQVTPGAHARCPGLRRARIPGLAPSSPGSGAVEGPQSRGGLSAEVGPTCARFSHLPGRSQVGTKTSAFAGAAVSRPGLDAPEGQRETCWIALKRGKEKEGKEKEKRPLRADTRSHSPRSLSRPAPSHSHSAATICAEELRSRRA